MSTFLLELVTTDRRGPTRIRIGQARFFDIVANGLPVERYRKLLLELYHVVWHFNPTCAAAAMSNHGSSTRAVRYFLYDHMNGREGS